MGRLISCILCIATTAAIAAAQRTWVVDAAGGTGTDFRDLPAAFLRISSGDTLLIRKGNYSAFQTSKAVRMLGGPAVRVNGAVIISGTAAGSAFVIKSVKFSGSGFIMEGTVTLRNCAGRIVFADVEAKDPTTGIPRAALAVHNSRAVTLNRFNCLTGMVATASTITATNSVFKGTHAQNFVLRPIAGSSGIASNGSTLVLGQCQAIGGNGLVRLQNGIGPSSALYATNCSIVITGDKSTFTAGQSGNPATVPALKGNGGNLLLDPIVSLVPFNNSPKFAGFAKTFQRRLAALEATGAAPGGTLRSDLYSAKGQTIILFASPLADPVLLGTLGQLWLDPRFLLLLDVGVQGSSEHRLTSIRVPKSAALSGLPLVLQALSGVATGMELSTAAHVVLH